MATLSSRSSGQRLGSRGRRPAPPPARYFHVTSRRCCLLGTLISQAGSRARWALSPHELTPCPAGWHLHPTRPRQAVHMCCLESRFQLLRIQILVLCTSQLLLLLLAASVQQPEQVALTAAWLGLGACTCGQCGSCTLQTSSSNSVERRLAVRGLRQMLKLLQADRRGGRRAWLGPTRLSFRVSQYCMLRARPARAGKALPGLCKLLGWEQPVGVSRGLATPFIQLCAARAPRVVLLQLVCKRNRPSLDVCLLPNLQLCVQCCNVCFSQRGDPCTNFHSWIWRWGKPGTSPHTAAQPAPHKIGQPTLMRCDQAS